MKVYPLLFIVCLMPWSVSSIVLGGHGTNCLVGSCNCSTVDTLDCSNRGLTAIPPVSSPRQGHLYLLTLQFASNDLTAIRNNAFHALNGVHIHRIRLILSDNYISSIANNAFHGIEDKINEIILTNNLLQSIPGAVAHLQHLHTLDIVNNPIGNFSGLASLSRGLGDLALGHSNMTKWPTTINKLIHLHKLSIHDAGITAIPSDAFYKWSQITYLTLKGTNLYDFPESLCILRRLQTLEYSYNQVHASEVNFFKPCAHGGFSGVTELILDNDDFYQAPTDIFGTFPNLHILRIRGSKVLTNLDDLTVPNSNQLQTLDLTGNNLAAIPEVVVHMNRLTTIDVSNNPITCSCFMRWIKTWSRRDNVTITGTCVGGEQIRHYIDNSLQNFC